MRGIYFVVLSLVGASALCMPFAAFEGDEGYVENLRMEMVNFHLDSSSLKFHRVDGYDLIQIEGLKSFTNPGEPMLPVRSYSLKLEMGAEIISLEATGLELRNLSHSLRLLPTPSPLMWKDIFDREFLPDESVYESEVPFPGKLFDYDVGRDGKNTYLYLRVYPVQYVPKLEKVSIITDITIEVQYLVGHSDDVPLEEFGSDCVIITPTEFYWQARDLAQYHENVMGVSTTVVNTTWIYSNYDEATDPPFPGYWDDSLSGWSTIVNYDYSLAKRIVSFLNDTSEHPNLSFVLLYGNGSLVPPSYYFYDRSVGGFLDYEAWIPTDFFYSSPDYDLVPTFLVGRLPVNDSKMAGHVNEKIGRWYDNSTGNWTKNVVVAGGRPFMSPFYVGELIVQDSINQGFFEGSNLTKMLRSDYRFDKEDLLPAFSGEVALTYLISHGSGDAVYLNESMMMPMSNITVSDIMNLEENSNVSVVVSIACDNGAFDNGVVAETPFDSSISFGESLIFSRAGAIAYIGGSRSNAGNPVGVLEEGYLNVTSESYMADILTRVVQAYSERATSLGNMTRMALMNFVAENDMSDLTNQRSLFEFVLLGDPVLPLIPPGGTGYLQPQTKVLNPFVYENVSLLPLATGTMPIIRPGKEVVVNITTDSSTVGVKIIDTPPDDVVERGSNITTDNKTSYGFMPQNETIHLFRASSEDGKEGWTYLRISPNPVAPVLKTAFLSGANDANVTISWYRSTDDGIENGTTLYRIMRSYGIDGPYVEVASRTATAQPIYNFTDVGKGDGDTTDYFYFVQSVNENMYFANSSLAGKMAISLAAGWHLISFPLVQENSTLEATLRTLDFRSVRFYDSSKKHWMTYQTFKGYHDLEELDITMGFWIEVTSNDHLALAGLVPEMTDIHLHEGWNLVSFPSFMSFYPVMILKFMTGAERVEGFDPLAPPYFLRVMDDFENLMPSQGYWVKVPGDVTWTVWGS